MSESVICLGCGAPVEDIPGNPHKYLGASAGCWKIYGEILASEYGDFGYPETTHRLTVGTYAVQHPGKPDRQAIKSVNVHLISLFLILERGLDGAEATFAIRKILQQRLDLTWLEPPVPNGTVTVLDIAAAADFKKHQRVVEAWAENVWQAWSSYHRRIQGPAERFLR